MTIISIAFGSMSSARRRSCPLTKIPGEHNSADLMTKHLSITMILRHMANLNLAHVGGRSEAAAKLHAVGEMKAPSRSVSFIDPDPRRAVGDYWSKGGEQGRWVRVHVDPRVVRFHPWRAPRGPGRRTKLKPDRIAQGIYEGGGDFQETDKWQA